MRSSGLVSNGRLFSRGIWLGSKTKALVRGAFDITRFVSGNIEVIQQQTCHSASTARVCSAKKDDQAGLLKGEILKCSRPCVCFSYFSQCLSNLVMNAVSTLLEEVNVQSSLYEAVESRF